MSLFVPAPLPSVTEIRRRLEVIFPDGTMQRPALTSEAAAKTVYTMLFIDAVEGRNVRLAPKHVYRMAQEVADDQSEKNRLSYATRCLKPKYQAEGTAWYADTTRELIRDDTIREAMIPIGVVVNDASVPTTSSKGRYYLKKDFASLFSLSNNDFENKVIDWQESHLSASELARVRILQGRHNHGDSVKVNFPNGETRIMQVGKSSVITKAVVEEFSPRFLDNPYVLWISESGEKVVHQDNALMKQIGLNIDETTLLPDLVLADLRDSGVLIVFVEVVATDGVVTETRKRKLLEMAEKAGFSSSHIAFMTAFEKRDAGPLKKRISGIATDTMVWSMAEPKVIIWIGENQEIPVSIQE
ncbi:BsuBI/PstI family type II restriction endonuclease [Halomonas sp. C05BenzN]|uniref:BsuBI/PstI family type II restriction endonuclease n=1 Tax=Halomonas sp. C05BenzN TaxID=3411041 RepID=UPI003B939654